MFKKLFIFLLFILVLAQVTNAQKVLPLTTDRVTNSILVNMGCEGTNCAGLTVDSTAGGVTLTSSAYNPTVTDQPSGYSQAQRADCYNSGNKIWVTTNPNITLTTGRGIGYADATYFTVYGYTNIKNLHAIRDASSSSTLYCDYYRQQ